VQLTGEWEPCAGPSEGRFCALRQRARAWCKPCLAGPRSSVSSCRGGARPPALRCRLAVAAPAAHVTRYGFSAGGFDGARSWPRPGAGLREPARRGREQGRVAVHRAPRPWGPATRLPVWPCAHAAGRARGSWRAAASPLGRRLRGLSTRPGPAGRGAHPEPRASVRRITRTGRSPSRRRDANRTWIQSRPGRCRREEMRVGLCCR
jgi:hypothetical protein